MTASWIDSCVESRSKACSVTESGSENCFGPWSEQPGKELGRPLHRPASIFLPVSKADLRTFGGGHQSAAAIPACGVLPPAVVPRSRHRQDRGCYLCKPFSFCPTWLLRRVRHRS